MTEMANASQSMSILAHSFPEFSHSEGDEDLIALGRKFADALDRQERHHLDDAKGIDREMKAYGVAVDDADRLCAESTQLKATTILGLRIKGWCALYMCKGYMECPQDDTALRVFMSLLQDLVPPSHQEIPGTDAGSYRRDL